jgi:hypothetical protein
MCACECFGYFNLAVSVAEKGCAARLDQKAGAQPEKEADKHRYGLAFSAILSLSLGGLFGKIDYSPYDMRAPITYSPLTAEPWKE